MSSEKETPPSPSKGCRLPDLCAGDKSRVARLISQLVHVGKEHERSAALWEDERQRYDERLARLRRQNEELVTEVCKTSFFNIIIVA